MEGAVRLERRGAVATLWFDRPAAHNAVTWSMYEQLMAACDEVDATDDLRVVLVRGAGGRAFVAGTDIGQFASFTGGADGLAYERRIDEAVGRLERVRRATVAVVEGPAVGGGLALAAACDLRVCTPGATFGMPIARTLGNCLSGRNYNRLVWMLGPSRVSDLLFRARLLSAAEAAAVGFVHDVVEPDELLVHLDEVANELCRRAPLTLWATKEAVRRIIERTVPNTDDLTERCYGSEDFREGVRAFTSRRDAEWRAR